MGLLRLIFAGSAGAILGLLAYGLAPVYPIACGLVGFAVAFGGVFLFSTLSGRVEDRDPTIRPPNVPYDDDRVE